MIVVNELEKNAYSEKKVEKSPWATENTYTAPKVDTDRYGQS